MPRPAHPDPYLPPLVGALGRCLWPLFPEKAHWGQTWAMPGSSTSTPWEEARDVPEKVLPVFVCNWAGSHSGHDGLGGGWGRRSTGVVSFPFDFLWGCFWWVGSRYLAQGHGGIRTAQGRRKPSVLSATLQIIASSEQDCLDQGWGTQWMLENHLVATWLPRLSHRILSSHIKGCQGWQCSAPNDQLSSNFV